jgi:hypothetical protein
MRTMGAPFLLCLLALVTIGCGAPRGSGETTTAAVDSEASSGDSTGETADVAPEESSGASASGGDVRTVTALDLMPLAEGYVGQRVHVHGFAIQTQSGGGRFVEIQVGDAHTSDSQPYVSCRPAQDVTIPETAVEWMGEVDVEGTVEVARGAVLLTRCTLRS